MGMTPLPDVVRTGAQAPTSRNARTTRGALAVAAVLGAGALLVACGSVAAPGSGGAGSSSAGSTPAAPTSPGLAATARVSIDVTFVATSGSPARHYTLRCDPAGGTTLDPAVACGKLLTGDDIFAPRPLRVACPMVLMGDGRATITGTYFGRPEHLIIVNGSCDLSRWTELKTIFG